LALHLPFVETILKETLFGLFCAGTTLQEAQIRIESLYKTFNIRTMLSYAVESEQSEEGFDDAYNKTLESIRHAAKHKEISHCVVKVTGFLPSRVLEKSSLRVLEQKVFARGVERITSLVETAQHLNISIMIDAEESWLQDRIDVLCENLMRRFNRSKAVVFTTVQMYLSDKLEYLQRLIERASAEHFVAGIKLG
jgi:proline dehydrogenase